MGYMENNKKILIILLAIIAAALVYIGIILTPHTPKIRVQSDASKRAAIQKILASQDGIFVPIQECSIGNQTYFRLQFSIMDGDDVLYDQDGNFSAGCGGGLLPPGTKPRSHPEQCSQITQCTTVYGAEGSSFDVDVYDVRDGQQQKSLPTESEGCGFNGEMC